MLKQLTTIIGKLYNQPMIVRKFLASNTYFEMNFSLVGSKFISIQNKIQLKLVGFFITNLGKFKFCK